MSRPYAEVLADPTLCASAKQIIAQDGDTCITVDGDVTRLYWHIDECATCAELRQRGNKPLNGIAEVLKMQAEREKQRQHIAELAKERDHYKQTVERIQSIPYGCNCTASLIADAALKKQQRKHTTTVEQLVRDLLVAAVKEGLVRGDAQRIQSMTAGDAMKLANMVAAWLVKG